MTFFVSHCLPLPFRPLAAIGPCARRQGRATCGVTLALLSHALDVPAKGSEVTSQRPAVAEGPDAAVDTSKVTTASFETTDGSTAARMAPSAAECINANETALALKQQAKLREARQSAAFCTQPSCPHVVRSECARLGETWRALQPRVGFRVVDVEGNELSDVRLFVDGAPVEPEGGDALDVDPGEHTARVALDGYLPQDLTFVAQQGDQALVLTVTLRHARSMGEPRQLVASRTNPPAPSRSERSESTTRALEAPPDTSWDVFFGVERLNALQVAGISAAGVGVLSLAAGGVLIVLAEGKHREALANGCNEDALCTTQVGKQLADAARHRANLATPFVIGGGVLLVGGISALLVDVVSSKEQPETATFAVQPMVGLDACGVHIDGWF